MAEEKQTKPEEKKMTEETPKTDAAKAPEKEIKSEAKPESKEEGKTKDKSEKAKPKQEVKIEKKEFAIAKSLSIHASKKHCMYICSFIKNKKIDDAIADLESVINMKIAIPFKGEIPHRKGKMMSGRYPVNASKIFIPLLKTLKGNATVNGLDLDKTVISEASASWASRPLRRGNVEGKRTNVILKASEIKLTKGNKK